MVDRSTSCTRCGAETLWLGTKLCDPCWEKKRHGVFKLEDEVERLTKANQDLIERLGDLQKAMAAVSELLGDLD